MLEDLLEIFLVTYNRKIYLKETLESIFSSESPIRNCSITVLDNKSDDGSSELIDEYAVKYKNLTHIRHNRNIGGNANICRCYELASKKYFWILCDDDAYDWTSWNDVLGALNDGVDAVVVAKYISPEENIAQLICQLSFVPAAIYKTENISDTVMQNAEFQISALFPHLALVCELINENKNIRIVRNPIVNRLSHPEMESYTRGISGNKHPIMRNMTWTIGMMATLQLISDKSTQAFVFKSLRMENGVKLLQPEPFLNENKTIGHNSSFNKYVYYGLGEPFLSVKELHSFYVIAFSASRILLHIFMMIVLVLLSIPSRIIRTIKKLGRAWRKAFALFRQSLKKTKIGQLLLPLKRRIYPGSLNSGVEPD